MVTIVHIRRRVFLLIFLLLCIEQASSQARQHPTWKTEFLDLLCSPCPCPRAALAGESAFGFLFLSKILPAFPPPAPISLLAEFSGMWQLF
ncbi:hypothetical protein SLEP1_g27628 [Rubroshorea leprosula]|uniref:Secreted protein n=1 Tax=Rubroshorea leprosula TaxID=152421 RepID=A0AAV5K0A9_9ROSI|nr:hypothetical protein SLEP1_g27628 [Rubroshorea leprosula]